VAAIGYWRTGSPALLWPGTPAQTAATAGAPPSSASAPNAMEQIAALVGQLAERMKDNPADAEGWTMLARSYTVLGRFEDAIPAYARVVELIPSSAPVLADYADAVAATKGTIDNAQSVDLIERALKADPRNPKALALAGTVAYERADYASAIGHWQKVADQLPPGSELAPRVQASIADARGRLGGSGGAAAGSQPAGSLAASPSASRNQAGARAGSVSGTVTLDPSVAAQASPGDTVFVFARPASGARMPLAVLRAQVRDLPLSFTLDDSMAMAPGMTLSSAAEVVVGARVSKTGNAIAQPGDLSGEITGVKPGAKNIAVRIGGVVAKP
jgi:cytochrome c-type biogenesis protein CcmH